MDPKAKRNYDRFGINFCRDPNTGSLGGGWGGACFGDPHKFAFAINYWQDARREGRHARNFSGRDGRSHRSGNRPLFSPAKLIYGRRGLRTAGTRWTGSVTTTAPPLPVAWLSLVWPRRVC